MLKREFDQASIVVGHSGPARNSPDIYRIQLFNRYFGHGSFGSLLFREIRSNMGLAYSVYGGIWPGFERGTVQIQSGTRVNKVTKAIRAILDLSKQVQVAAPKVEETKRVLHLCSEALSSSLQTPRISQSVRYWLNS